MVAYSLYTNKSTAGSTCTGVGPRLSKILLLPTYGILQVLYCIFNCTGVLGDHARVTYTEIGYLYTRAY
jgi:hypothetical protein